MWRAAGARRPQDSSIFVSMRESMLGVYINILNLEGILLVIIVNCLN